MRAPIKLIEVKGTKEGRDWTGFPLIWLVKPQSVDHVQSWPAPWQNRDS